MGYLKLLLVVQILVCIELITPNTVKIHIRLDSNCTTERDDGHLAPGIAVDSANQLFAYMTSGTKLETCCCQEKVVTCYMDYTGSPDISTLQTYISSLSNTACYGGSYIANMAVEAFPGKKDTCHGKTNFTVGGGNLTRSHCHGNETDFQTLRVNISVGKPVVIPDEWYFVCDRCSTGSPTQCCRMGETITCFISYHWSAHWLYLLSDCQNTTNSHTGAQITNFSVVETGSKKTCEGGGNIDIPLRDHVVKNSNCSGNASIDLSSIITSYVGANRTGPTTDTQAGDRDTQTNDKSKTIGGAVGGTLGALSAIGPLAYYMYRKLKRNSRVGDTNSSTDLTAVPPSVDFEEAPNSVPPAGTG